MRKLRAILLVIAGLSVAVCLADSPAGSDVRPDVKDADAQRIIHVMDTADAKAYADYLRAVEKIHHDAFTKLNVRKGELTRQGKLDDAVAIRSFVDFVTQEDNDNDTAVASDGTKLFMPVDKVVGMWGENHGTGRIYNFLSNGRFTCKDGQSGVWKITASSLTLTWTVKGAGVSYDRVDTYSKFDSGDGRLDGDSQRGSHYAITIWRMPPDAHVDVKANN